MRFMMIMFPKVYQTAKAGFVPNLKDMEEMGQYNEELGKAGVLLALDGLTPPATCFSYNDELRKNGHLIAEEPLQPANTAVTVYWKSGKVAVTDGPYAETKEQLGGIQVLEARDLN